MDSNLNRAFILVAAFIVSACASSLPPNFLYETSLRGEQGFMGSGDRREAAEKLLNAGVVKNPEIALKKGAPDEQVNLRRWGLRYFPKNWSRYQIVLDADIGTGKSLTRCRAVSTKTPNGAPTLQEVLANDGALVQRELEAMIAACLVKNGER
jgi:hypothetical protein